MITKYITKGGLKDDFKEQKATNSKYNKEHSTEDYSGNIYIYIYIYIYIHIHSTLNTSIILTNKKNDRKFIKL